MRKKVSRDARQRCEGLEAGRQYYFMLESHWGVAAWLAGY